MGKKGAGDNNHRLKVGRGVAVSRPRKSTDELAATVTQISPAEICLEFPRPGSQPPFQKGEPVRIKYWEERVVYCWDAKVVKISGPGNQQMAVSIQGVGVTLQRRKSLRMRLQVPFSFTVIGAAETKLIGQKVLDAKTRDIGVGGLRFNTNLQLEVRDKLQVKLDLSSSRHVSASGWVVRATRVEKKGKYVHSIGLEFLQVEEEDQRQLLLFLVMSDDSKQNRELEEAKKEFKRAQEALRESDKRYQELAELTEVEVEVPSISV